MLLALLCVLACSLSFSSFAGQVETPPDPGLEASLLHSDAIVEVEILAGTPFRAVASKIRALKGDVPDVFELEGFNTYNWDTVHRGFSTGTRHIVFLSRTDRPDVFSTLTPSAPRLGVQGETILLSFGDPPFRVPVPARMADEMLAVLIATAKDGKAPERATVLVKDLWAKGEIEARYVAVALAGLLRDANSTQTLIEASRDKLLRLRLFAVESLGRVGTAEANAALIALLKDERATVAREAARMLVGNGDVDSLPQLLDWVRRNAVPPAAAKNADQNRERTEIVISAILKLSHERVFFADAAVNRALLDIAKGRNGQFARMALAALAASADAADVNTLLELADDRTYELNQAAFNLLKQITLAPAEDVADFREWWSKAEKGFNEDMKRDRVDAACRLLARAADRYDGKPALETLRHSPGGIAAISAAPVLLKTETQALIHTDDLSAWNTPLVLPFLIERLARDASSERRDALEAVVKIAERHPRLVNFVAPYVLAGLSDEDSSYRRVAQSAVGRLNLARGLSGVLDGVQYAGTYEAQDAAKSVFTVSARTLGFSVNEPPADQLAARKRLRGWWQSAEKTFAAQTALVPVDARLRLWMDRPAAERIAALEKMLVDPDSRRASAAFEVLLRERGPDDANWKKMLERTRHRDKAHGILGQFGGDAALVADLSKRAFTEGDGAESMLVRVLSLSGLASLNGPGRATGAAKIVEWLNGPGAKADLPWRRIAVMLLAQADGEPKSLAYLDALLKDGFEKITSEESSDTPGTELTFAAICACSARADATPQLMRVLDSAKNRRWREQAARELSARRHAPALKGILAAVVDADRYNWPNLARAADPLLTAKDVPAIAELFEIDKTPARITAGYLLQVHPEFALDPLSKGKLLKGLDDLSSAVRYYATMAVSKHKTVAATDKLRELLKDDDDEVRAAAAEALGNLGDPAACKDVADALDTGRRIDARWLRALAVLGDDEYMAVLLKLCNSNLHAEQRAGLEALGPSKHKVALDTLLKIFRNDDQAMQTIAGDTLAQKGPQAVAALKEDLESKDDKIRRRAIQLLARIPGAAAKAELQRIANSGDAEDKKLAQFGLTRHEAAQKLNSL